MNDILIYSTGFILFSLYSCLEGSKDGFLYYYRNSSEQTIKTELHPLFALERLAIGGIILFITFNYLFVLSLGLTFSFWHNGFYYIKRNQLQPTLYKRKFRDQSSTSSAYIELTFEQRTWIFILGVICFVGSILIQYL